MILAAAAMSSIMSATIITIADLISLVCLILLVFPMVPTSFIVTRYTLMLYHPRSQHQAPPTCTPKPETLSPQKS